MRNKGFMGLTAFLIIAVVALLLIAGIYVFWMPQKTQLVDPINNSDWKEDLQEKLNVSNDLLEVATPTPNQKISSPVLVSGKSNFFEAHTRIRIVDDNGNVLADTFATAEGWMDKLYPFSQEVKYSKPQTKNGLVEVFDESPKDGKELNKVSIPVEFID